MHLLLPNIVLKMRILLNKYPFFIMLENSVIKLIIVLTLESSSNHKHGAWRPLFL